MAVENINNNRRHYRHPIPFDPDFKGPLKNRSCTDIICLLLIFVFIGCWIGIGAYAISKGDISTLLVPKDSKGLRCGLDSAVKDKPYLFFFDLTKCLSLSTPINGCDTPQVCVKHCPSELFIANDNTVSKPSTVYCKDGERTFANYVPEECAHWHLPSDPFEKRCIPNLKDKNAIDKLTQSIDVTLDTIKKAISNVKLLSEAEQVGQNIVKDVVNSWWKICIGLLIASVICIIYILMLRWIAAIMVWLSVFLVVIGLGAAVAFCAIKYKEFLDKIDAEKLEEELGSLKQKRDLWLFGLIVASVIFLITFLTLVFLRKRIALAIALIKESSRAVSSVTSVLVFPIFPWVLHIGVIAYAIIVGLFLASTGDPVYKIRNCTNFEQTTCDPDTFNEGDICAGSICKFIKMDNPPLYGYLQAFNVIGFVWLAFFVTDLGHMILSSVFAQWYWTFNKRNLPFFAVTEATFRVLRYHIGTLAFGSLIITICRLIRVCLEYISKKTEVYHNPVARAIVCCLRCFFWCLEKFLKFINKNAYIMCAIHGKNFCSSAKDAFLLLMRNILRVVVLDKITDFLFFLSKLVVTLGVGAIAYVIFATDLTAVDNSGLNYNLVPVIIIMICTYIISSVFFDVYSVAVDTLFLCFLEDCERNDGSSSKPYFMSKNLMQILGKKNKRE